ncbi:unnamed protein product [Calypogeia fissa]
MSAFPLESLWFHVACLIACREGPHSPDSSRAGVEGQRRRVGEGGPDGTLRGSLIETLSRLGPSPICLIGVGLAASPANWTSPVSGRTRSGLSLFAALVALIEAEVSFCVSLLPDLSSGEGIWLNRGSDVFWTSC